MNDTEDRAVKITGLGVESLSAYYSDNYICLDSVFSAISFISSLLAGCGLGLYTKKGRSLDVVDNNPEFSNLLSRPNPDYSYYSLMVSAYFNMLLYGNAYFQIVMNGAYRPSQLWPIPTCDVEPDIVGGRLQYNISTVSGTVILMPSEVIHLRGPGLVPHLGLNINSVAGRTISAIQDIEKGYAKDAKSGGLKGFVVMPRIYEQKVEETVVNSLRRQRDIGSDINVLWDNAQYVSAGITPKDMEMLDTRKYSVTQIARLYGIPPIFLGEGTIPYGDIEGVASYLRTYCLGPRIKSIQDELTHKLCRPPYVIRIDADDLDMVSKLTRVRADATQVTSGVRSPNEIRTGQGYPAYDGGDAFWRPSNTVSATGGDNNPALHENGQNINE